jgi:hypothetical protein
MNFRAMSEARSCDETTIHAPTKTFRNLYHKQMSSYDTGTLTHTEASFEFNLINEFYNKVIFFQDMNTMAERDMASTVLLPHTHLYKPTTDRVRNLNF